MLPARMQVTAVPSPSGLHALRGGSARRQYDVRRPWDHRWDKIPAKSFRGYCDKPVPVPVTQRITERSEFEWIRPKLTDLGTPVLFGYGDAQQRKQRHRQPMRSSFQQPSPTGLLTPSSLYTSGSPRYHAALGRSRQVSHRPMTARPMTPRAHRADRPWSAVSITSPVHHALDVPASPRSRYFTGLHKALETAPAIDARWESESVHVQARSHTDCSLDSVFAEHQDDTAGSEALRQLMDI